MQTTKVKNELDSVDESPWDTKTIDLSWKLQWPIKQTQQPSIIEGTIRSGLYIQ